jgi:cyanate lyase
MQMNKSEMKQAILNAKQEKGLLWTDIARSAGLSPEFTCAACLGMHHLEKGQADAVAGFPGLGGGVSAALQRFPHKAWNQSAPTDPVIYRWCEMVGVYGETTRELIHEKFGDGIMSAIDFTMNVDKQDDPKGDRVLVTISGKFLPTNPGDSGLVMPQRGPVPRYRGATQIGADAELSPARAGCC